jgi:hypothetical protein
MIPNLRRRFLLVLLGLALTTAAGCIKAPNVVLLDHKTALEQQAAGEFRAIENDLLQAGISPKGEDIARSQLEAEGSDLAESTLGEMVRIYSAVQTDAEWIDKMLVAGCVGEGLDGLLQQTPDHCTQDVETGSMARILGRTNLHRRQIWRVIQKRESGASEDEVRDVWRGIHLKRVVCGGLIQRDENTWEKKKC